jgi:hypothetical protein
LIIYLSRDDYNENKLTIRTMKEYGIDNVRGWAFCQKKLSNSDIINLLFFSMYGLTNSRPPTTTRANYNTRGRTMAGHKQ